MSVQTSAPPYPQLLGWFTGGKPVTAGITVELGTMAKKGDLTRLLTALRLHDQIGSFHEALQLAFPKLDLAAPQFPETHQELPVLKNERLKTVGTKCLNAIASGEPEPLFSVKLFKQVGTELFYDDVPVFAMVAQDRKRVHVTDDTIHITSTDHDLNVWLQWKNADVKIHQIYGVEPDRRASGYNVLTSPGGLVWTCLDEELKTPEAVIRAIDKSKAFSKIKWGRSFCTSGWVSSLMPTLGTKGTFRLPAGEVTIGQNVHSDTVIGSAWIESLKNMDCKQKDFPLTWKADVKALLCPLTNGHADFQTIKKFCGYLETKFNNQDEAPTAELKKRITYLITNYPLEKETLQKLPNIQRNYKELFQTT
ncbi:hypothetical protein ACIRQQ_33650 [Streptomyces fuscichromogenes]|uniref:hypothetical protein n=1 Tax=Streptomyces fuscichromogenes TaxID=1324013 RepID=UPI00381F5CE6